LNDLWKLAGGEIKGKATLFLVMESVS